MPPSGEAVIPPTAQFIFVPRLLIYGFGPYRQFKDNITQKILRGLRTGKGVKKIVFPVRFQKRQFIDALKKYKPDVILGLGQASRTKRLKVERRAINKWRNDRKQKPRRIALRGPARLRTTLKLDGGSTARVSYNAGDYVCNYSIYVMLDAIKRRRLKTLFGFIHVPRDYEVGKARRFLERAIRALER